MAVTFDEALSPRAAASPMRQSPSLPLAQLITSLGRDTFSRVLFESLAGATGASHMSIIGFDDYLMPSVVAAESRGGILLARDAGHTYQTSLLYTHDPTRRSILERPATAEGPIIGRLRASEILNRAYRDRIYDRYGLIERLTLIDQTDGRWYALNLYRTGADGFFDKSSVTLLSNSAGVVSALVAKHLFLTSTASSVTTRSVAEFEILVRSAAPVLTPRQIEVCARALMGMTNAGIGSDLGIQTSTVSTLRKRAYAAMGISSLNELFTRCLVRPRVH